MIKPAGKILHAGLDDAPPNVRHSVILFRAIVGLGGRLRTAMDRQLADAGITSQQAALLTLAGNLDPPPTQGRLAELLGTSHQNVRQLADALERKGLLETRVDPDDRRIRRFVPSPAVADIFAERDTRDFEAVAHWFSALDDDELATAARLLEKLILAV